MNRTGFWYESFRQLVGLRCVIWKFGCLQKHGYFHLELCLKLWTRKISPRRVESRSCCQQNSSTVELVDHTHTQSYVQFSYKHVAVTWGPTGTQRHADNTFYQIRCGSAQFFANWFVAVLFASHNKPTCLQRWTWRRASSLSLIIYLTWVAWPLRRTGLLACCANICRPVVL